jgi:hypothetical protein
MTDFLEAFMVMRSIFLSILFSFVSYGQGVLFVFFDAGETKALTPVVKQLKEQGVAVQVLVSGTARTLVEDAVDLNMDCDISPFIGNQSLRTTKLEPASLAGLDACIEKPDVVVTGLVSTWQNQVSQYYKKQNIPIAGYYDAFSAPGNSHFVNHFRDSLTVLLSPGKTVGDALTKKFPNIPVHVVGQPTLNQWSAVQLHPDSDAEKWFSSIKGKTLLWVGGYGSGYKEAFSHFLDMTSRLPFTVVVSLHPRMDGELEKDLIKMHGMEQKVKIMPKSISTAQGALKSHILVCHRSTVGIQALVLPRPVIYLDQLDSGYTNIAIRLGAVAHLWKAEDFFRELHHGLFREQLDRVDRLHKEIPSFPVQNIVREILNLGAVH